MRRNRWSRERVVAALRERAATGQRADGSLRAIARYYFGSTAKALSAAGIEPVPRPRWSRADLVSIVRGMKGAGFPGSRRLRQEARRLRRDLRRGIRRHFGSFGAMKATLGLATWPLWTKSRAIAEVRAAALRGRIRTAAFRKRNRRLVAACERLFGGWRRALQAAGVRQAPPRNPGPVKYDRPVILRLLEEAWAKRDIRVRSLRRKYAGLYPAVQREFGSWNAGLEAAGVPVYAYSSPMASHRIVLEQLRKSSSRPSARSP